MKMLAFSLVQRKIDRIKKIYTNFVFGLDLFSNGLLGGAKFHLLGDTKVREWR